MTYFTRDYKVAGVGLNECAGRPFYNLYLDDAGIGICAIELWALRDHGKIDIHDRFLRVGAERDNPHTA